MSNLDNFLGESPRHSSRRLGSVGTVGLGIYLIALAPLMFYLLVTMWPKPFAVAVSPDTSQKYSVTTASTPSEETTPGQVKSFKPLWDLVDLAPVTVFGWTFGIWGEERLLILVALGGAIGSYLRSVISFSSYAKTGRLPTATWMWTCVLQIYVGMFLALIFYFIMRGTTTPLTTEASQINPFTTVGVAGVVGLFTQQATDKLAAFFGSVTLGSERNESPKGAEGGCNRRMKFATVK